MCAVYVSVCLFVVCRCSCFCTDEEVFLNTKHLPLDNKPDDGTPRRGDIGTSPDRRKLVALFNIRGGQLEGGVCSPTSPPLQLGQPLQPVRIIYV